MLHKSIASKLDLGKELCDARSVVEELKRRLSQAEQQRSYFFSDDESVEAVYERMLSAENTCQVFLGTSKDLLARINTIQFSLSTTSVPNSNNTSTSGMERTIEDLKDKSLRADTRAENAESKCKLLTDTNLELNEELSFMRGRVQGLENSLRQANHLRKSTENHIAVKTKTIGDLVAKLALERERLHLQIVSLTKKNRILAQKCRENVHATALLSRKATAEEGELRTMEAKEEPIVDSSSTQTKVTPTTVNTLRDQDAEVNPPLEDDSGAETTVETVRSIEPSQLNWKYLLTAVLVLLAAVLVYQLYTDAIQRLLRQFIGF